MVRYTFVNLYNESLSYKLHLYSIPYLSGLSPNRHAKPDCGRVRFSPHSNGPNMPHGCSFPQPTCINIYLNKRKNMRNVTIFANQYFERSLLLIK